MSTWNEVSARLGRNDLPATLAYAVLVHGTLTDRDEIAKGVEAAWTAAEFPAQIMDTDVWLTLFTQVGGPFEYLHDENVRERSELPDEVTLYRGATDEHKLGMSWTDDPARAAWFARRFNGMRTGEVGRVWTVTVDADAVLARFETGRGEAEWVLDPYQLQDSYEVEPYEAPDGEDNR